MTLRIRFLITALFLCHQLPASSLVTSQLLAEISGQSSDISAPRDQQKTQGAATPCASQAANEESDQTTICATSQEKDGNVYKLHGNAEIHYRDYVLRADEVTYNSDSGEAAATGHVTLDGGPDDDHIKASHGTYDVTAETGRFYDVTGSTGVRFSGNRVVLTSTSPFSFTGKIV
jgi:LPS-assembly protein